MSTPVLPVYGRFEFPGIEAYISRLWQAETFVSGAAGFATYASTRSQQTYYGLDTLELFEWFAVYGDEARSMTSSVSGPSGRSVTVTVRFSGPGAAEATCIVAMRSPYENRTVLSILQGVWQAPAEEEQARTQLLAALIGAVAAWRTVRPAAMRFVPPPPAAYAQPATERDTFRFDDQLPFSRLAYLAETLSQQYLGGAPFNFRLITSTGDTHADMDLRGVQAYFEHRRGQIFRVQMDAATARGELVELKLSFGPMARWLNAEIDITAFRSKDIKALIRDTLLNTVERLPNAEPMMHEMFSFHPARFVLSETVQVAADLSAQYLQGAPLSAEIRSAAGESWTGLSVRQLDQRFRELGGQPAFLLIGASSSLLGQQIGLAFHFRPDSGIPFGSLSLRWLEDGPYQEAREYVWAMLGLEPYTFTGTESGGAHQPRPMEVRPVFPEREFPVKARHALLFAPRDTYWYEPCRARMAEVLGTLGWELSEGAILDQAPSLRSAWAQLNEHALVIADLTYKRAELFYLVGIAHVLGKPVLLLSQNQRDIPDAFKPFPHILYEYSTSGLQQLTDRLIERLKASTAWG